MRKAVGDDYRLMLDSTWSYDYPAALRVGRAAEALNFYWYEDPLHYDDLWLRKAEASFADPNYGDRNAKHWTHFLCAMGDGASDRLPSR